MLSDFFKVKSIPKLFWTSEQIFTTRPKFVSVLMLLIGLTVFGLGEALLVAANFGVSPWTVLAQGVSSHFSWSLGISTAAVSSFVLLLWLPIKQVPGLGTIFNIIIIALVIDLSLPYLPTFENKLLKLLLATVGVCVTGFGGAIYLIANLGPGPRDGLMTGIQRITDWPIAVVRGIIELTVVILGWWLGGVVGIGTLLFAFGIGPALASSILLLQHILEEKF